MSSAVDGSSARAELAGAYAAKRPPATVRAAVRTSIRTVSLMAGPFLVTDLEGRMDQRAPEVGFGRSGRARRHITRWTPPRGPLFGRRRGFFRTEPGPGPSVCYNPG